MLRTKYALLVLALLIIYSCGNRDRETAEQQPEAANEQSMLQEEQAPAGPEAGPQPVKPAPAQPAPPVKTPVKEAPKVPEPAVAEEIPEAAEADSTIEENEPSPAVRHDTEEPAAEQPETKFVTIPNGTAVKVRLLDPLDTSVNLTGDSFRAVLDRDLEVNGTVAVPRGSIFEGKLINVTRSGRVEGRASMSLQLVQMIVGKQSYPVQTGTLTFEAESTKKKDAAKVGIGAGVGAVIGAIAGGGKGAAIGAAVGSGAGGATVLATRGNELKYDVEHVFDFVLSGDMTLEMP